MIKEYYSVVPGNLDVLHNDAEVSTDDRVLTGYVRAFASMEELLESDRLMSVCFAFPLHGKPHAVGIDADSDQAVVGSPDEGQELYVKPLVVRWRIELRDWLTKLSTDPTHREKAAELLERIAQSQKSGMQPDEHEFEEQPLDETLPPAALWAVVREGADPMRYPERFRVDGRDLPRGFVRAYFTRDSFLGGEEAMSASLLFADGTPPQVVAFEANEDHVYVPEEPDEDDPDMVYAKPRAILSTQPLEAWLEDARAIDPERTAELLDLIASSRAEKA